jgi:hypothetical protein
LIDWLIDWYLTPTLAVFQLYRGALVFGLNIWKKHLADLVFIWRETVLHIFLYTLFYASEWTKVYWYLTYYSAKRSFDCSFDVYLIIRLVIRRVSGITFTTSWKAEQFKGLWEQDKSNGLNTWLWLPMSE